MKTDNPRKSSWFSDTNKYKITAASWLNDSWSIQNLNELRVSVTDLRQELEKAEGDDKFDILTSLAQYHLIQKKIIHIMLENLIFELHRIHDQGSDIADEMEEAGYPFLDQFNESLTGYVLNRAQLERSIREL